MPFDEWKHEDHGGGGDDPRHEGVDELVKKLITMLIIFIRLEGKCLSCTMGALGITVLSKVVKAHRKKYGDEEGMVKYAQFVEDLAEASGFRTESHDERR